MKTLDFMKYRYLFFAISLIVIIGGITYGLMTGYRFDVDFKGGITIQADLKEEFDNEQVANIISTITGKKPLIQKLSTGNSVSITCDPMEQEVSDKIVEAMKAKYTQMDEPSVRNVQPSYGKELLNSAMLSVGVAMVIILLYVAVRFKTLGFAAAVTAIISLLHDILVIIAIYGVIKLPINSSFVAVLLTIIGYSINDTIIVYDRIRENKRKITKEKDMRGTINFAMTQVMKRTLMTSITTVAAILIVFIFSVVNNQEVLKEFSLPLVIGVIVGTYSSIFVASSLWYCVDNMLAKSKAKKTKKKA